MRRISFVFLAVLAIAVGLYPILYALADMSHGLLGTKPESLLSDKVWVVAFYLHISGGGLALLTGWSQFVTRGRQKRLWLHRTLGRTYVIACIMGGTAALYLAPYATGGIIATLGFGMLALTWLYTTIRAYLAIRASQTEVHREWMTRSYALTFAAVTLRIWLPLSQIAGIDFVSAYVVISWLCWIPNLIVAELLIRRRRPLVTGLK